MLQSQEPKTEPNTAVEGQEKGTKLKKSKKNKVQAVGSVVSDRKSGRRRQSSSSSSSSSSCSSSYGNGYGWMCAVCTFANPRRNTTCGMCQARKPLKGTSSRPSATKATLASSGAVAAANASKKRKRIPEEEQRNEDILSYEHTFAENAGMAEAILRENNALLDQANAFMAVVRRHTLNTPILYHAILDALVRYAQGQSAANVVIGDVVRALGETGPLVEAFRELISRKSLLVAAASKKRKQSSRDNLSQEEEEEDARAEEANAERQRRQKRRWEKVAPAKEKDKTKEDKREGRRSSKRVRLHNVQKL